MASSPPLPIGANVVVSFNDEPTNMLDRYVSFGQEVYESPDGDCVGDTFGKPDEEIFYYVDGIEEWSQILRFGHYEWTVHKWEFNYE